MRTLHIGNVGFTNTEPYRLVAPDFSVAWTDVDPSALAGPMARGELDCALLPTGALTALGESVRPLGPFGIGCRGRVLSLRLYAHVPVAALGEAGRKVFVTPRSTTTRALLRVLFAEQFGHEPTLTEDADAADAVLLIGDEAMEEARAEFRLPVSRDMSEWWFEQTSLPFVFAQWVVAAHVTPDEENALRHWIETSLLCAETAVGKERLIDAGVRAGWSRARAGLYFDRLDFRLTSAHLEGLALFQKLLKGIS